MESEVKIRTKDGHYIYGVLTKPKRPSDKVIVIVHGLACPTRRYAKRR